MGPAMGPSAPLGAPIYKPPGSRVGVVSIKMTKVYADVRSPGPVSVRNKRASAEYGCVYTVTERTATRTNVFAVKLFFDDGPLSPLELDLLMSLRHANLARGWKLEVCLDVANTLPLAVVMERYDSDVERCRRVHLDNVYRGVVAGLLHLHSLHVLHLDLKPANIMVCAGKGIIIDFGLSVQTPGRVPVFSRRERVTTGYKPPELVSGANPGCVNLSVDENYDPDQSPYAGYVFTEATDRWGLAHSFKEVWTKMRHRPGDTVVIHADLWHHVNPTARFQPEDLPAGPWTTRAMPRRRIAIRKHDAVVPVWLPPTGRFVAALSVFYTAALGLTGAVPATVLLLHLDLMVRSRAETALDCYACGYVALKYVTCDLLAWVSLGIDAVVPSELLLAEHQLLVLVDGYVLRTETIYGHVTTDEDVAQLVCAFAGDEGLAETAPTCRLPLCGTNLADIRKWIPPPTPTSVVPLAASAP